MDKREAKNLLHALMTAGTPPPTKAYYLHYTAGEEFRNLARNFAESITSLSNGINGYLPRVILGSIGIGKTHFLRYLYLLLEKEIGNDNKTICSWIELRELTDETDFQYLFIKGLSGLHEDFPVGTQYKVLLKNMYYQISESIVSGRNYSPAQKQIIMRKFLDLLVDTAAAISPLPHLSVPGKFFAKYVLQQMRKKQDKDRIELMRSKDITEGINQFSQIAFQKEFIYQFINLGEGNHSDSDFDRHLQDLAKQSKHNELIDLTMKLIYRAGFSRLIIFIDEMEHINSFRTSDTTEKYSERSAQILNLFHKLHQRMVDHAGQEKDDSYPSVAQIMVMPDYLLDSVITKIDPATAERLSINRFSLPVLPRNDRTTNELIRKIWELHEFAGYTLKSHAETAIRKIKVELYEKINKDRKPATMRHLIPRLIQIVQQDWIQK